ncbi:MAG: alpha/beta fold hydrolase [Chloroflexi bacterium]|nr:alpha/beta fold hydrolase [Chloroflexota bacterium]
MKIRGFRIELGEIEQALYRHAAVRDAVVIVRTDRLGEPRLVAYVVANKGTKEQENKDAEKASPQGSGQGGWEDESLTSDLRDQLQRTLPAYMIPSVFVVLDALPLTPNGKLDQAALPMPAVGSEAVAQGQPPLNAIEQALADIWAQVLGVEQINRDDNFFALGGDSILAIQAIARANQSGFQLSTRMLFQYQTIAELAEAAQAETSGLPVFAIQTPVSGTVPLTPIVAWFDELALAEPHHFNQALLLESSEPLDPQALQQALAALIAQHDALRLRFRHSSNSKPELSIDGVLDAPPVVVIEGDAATRDEQIQAIQAGLNLEHGPIVRLAIIRYDGDQRDALLFVAHHLAVDGLSWRILLEDLELAYRQIQRGESPQLPPKTTDLISWGQAIQAHATSDEVTAELSYWQSLAALPVSPLPTDGPGEENDVASAEVISISLDSTATEALLSRLPAAYAAHTDELLITALAWALQQWSGNTAIALALESHGRATLLGVDVSRTVGWFTSLYPVVLDLQAPSLPAAATSIGEQLRAVPSLGLSFGLARYLGDPETRAKLAALRTPEISFNYLGQFGRGAASASIFRPSAEDAGAAQGPRNQRPFAIDVVAVVQGDHLDVHWIFSKQLHRRATMNALAEGFVTACHELIARCPEQSAKPAGSEQRAVQTARQKIRDYGLLLPLNPRGTLPPFFCVHPSGGTVFCYRTLAQQLGADQPFYGIQAPGFEAGEQPFADLEQMATRYITEMRRIAPEGPYYIGGWSFGGIVAAEMARQLQAGGETVALLAIIDVDPDLSAYQRAQARRMIELSAGIAHADDLSPASIQRLRLGEQVDALFDERNSGGETIDRERFLTILRVFSAHARARIAYQPQPYAGRAVIFRARNQSILDAAKYAPRSLPLRRIAHKRRPRSIEPSMGWKRLISGPIEAYEVPGNHMTLLEEPFVAVLADRLRDVLRRIREAEANPRRGA